MHGPTVSALSSLALPYVPTNSFFLHTKTPTHRNSSPFPNQAYLFTLHPLCPTTPTEPPPHPTRIAHSSDWRTRWRSSRLGFSSFLFFFSSLSFLFTLGFWVWLHLFSLFFHFISNFCSSPGIGVQLRRRVISARESSVWLSESLAATEMNDSTRWRASSGTSSDGDMIVNSQAQPSSSSE